MNRKRIYLILFVVLFSTVAFSFGFYLGISYLYGKTEILNKNFEIEFEKQNEKIIDEIKKIEKKEKNLEKIDYLNSASFTGQIQNLGTLDEKNISNDFKAYDLKSDSSIQKFVNSKISFNEKSYVPKNLVKISGKSIIDTKGNQTLREEANSALSKMADDFFKETGEKIKVVSAYRDYNYQKGIKDRGCPDNLCAKAGFSEHQSGLVVDLWSASSQKVWNSDKKLKEYYSWLEKNAHKYGFHNTYQKGINIDGYDIEPWHWRFLGVELATYLKNNNLTIAEYYNKNI